MQFKINCRERSELQLLQVIALSRSVNPPGSQVDLQESDPSDVAKQPPVQPQPQPMSPRSQASSEKTKPAHLLVRKWGVFDCSILGEPGSRAVLWPWPQTLPDLLSIPAKRDNLPVQEQNQGPRCSWTPTLPAPTEGSHSVRNGLNGAEVQPSYWVLMRHTRVVPVT